MNTSTAPDSATGNGVPEHSRGAGCTGFSVAIVAPSLEILGGQGVQACSLLRALDGDGVAVSFVAVNPRFPKALQWLRRIPLLRTVVNQCLYLVSLWRLRDVDLVHVFSAAYWSFLLAAAPAMLAARAFGKPVILNYHSGEADDHLRHWGLRVHPWLHLADEIAVPSVYLQTVFATHGYRATVVPNIVDTSAFGYRRRSAIAPRILSNRNFEKHYGVDITLKAFAIIKGRYPDARLTVAGYGREGDNLRRWVRRRGLEGVSFVGRVEPDAMPALYDAVDIFVNASRIDNQPISILEAFAAGVPVISTPTGDIPTMLEQGRLGTLVPLDDVQALAGAVLAVLADSAPARRAARLARQRLRQYSWTVVGEQWLSLYTRVLSGGAGVAGGRDEPTAHL